MSPLLQAVWFVSQYAVVYAVMYVVIQCAIDPAAFYKGVRRVWVWTTDPAGYHRMQQRWGYLIRALDNELKGETVRERALDLRSRVDALCNHPMYCGNIMDDGDGSFKMHYLGLGRAERDVELDMSMNFFKAKFINA